MSRKSIVQKSKNHLNTNQNVVAAAVSTVKNANFIYRTLCELFAFCVVSEGYPYNRYTQCASNQKLGAMWV